ncbi:alpha/beta fold hydrolase [Actinoplanes sp. NPDC051633]|uniref:alpha/beta fold hydrolase n=1 Tax=Actinoplanes sp. NPDC051633 TaxID=3155670 RepID=UPI0034166507
MKKTLSAVVAAAVGLVLGGGSVPSAAQAGHGPGGYTPPPVSWGACSDPDLQELEAQCGFVTVPLDYAKPRGTKIKVAVSRVRHTSSTAGYQGIMLVNPGGPGGSGLGLASLGQFIPGGVGGDYDWIGFDPRGVGASQPSLTCDGDYAGYNRPPYVPTTKAIERAWLNRARGYANDCERAGGALLDHVKTTDNAADMDSIRKALGAKQINFYGFSYGTYLGQVYATKYPGKVRRMVFDGSVDPTRVWYRSNLDQDRDFNRNINIYFGWVAKYDSVYHLGTTAAEVRKRYYATERKLAKTPAGLLGQAELNDVVLSAAYYVYGWEPIAEALSALINDGDPEPILAFYAPPGPGADNGYAMYLATLCTDAPWPQSLEKFRRDNWKTYAKAPFATWSNAWFNAPCLFWDADTARRPVKVDGSKAPPILLIGETLDSATAFSGSLEVRKRFPRSVLVEGVGGTTHAGSLSGVACTDDTIAAYLDTGALPNRLRGNRSDKKCDPVPQPDPTAAAAARSADASGTGLGRPKQLTAIR